MQDFNVATLRGSIVFFLLVAGINGGSASAAIDDTRDLNNIEGWKSYVDEEIRKLNISSAPVDELLQSHQEDRFITSKIELDENVYFRSVLSVKTLTQARNLMSTQADVLVQLEKKYKVPAKTIVALWAVETEASRYVTRFPAMPLLVNRAYHDRENYSATQELIQALRLIESGRLDAKNLVAKADGTLGDFGFSPAAVARYGVDFNSDGTADLMRDNIDVLASYAFALKSLGWKDGEAWGREVRLPASFDAKQLNGNRQLSLQKWQQLGVRRADGSDLPSVGVMASLVRPKNANGRSYLVYNNYFSLLRWKRSKDFALAVSLVSEMLEDTADTSVFPFASN